MKFLSFREVTELSENQLGILRYCLERVLPEDIAGVEIDSISIREITHDPKGSGLRASLRNAF